MPTQAMAVKRRHEDEDKDEDEDATVVPDTEARQEAPIAKRTRSRTREHSSD